MTTFRKRSMRRLYRAGLDQKTIARIWGVKQQTVSRVLGRRRKQS